MFEDNNLLLLIIVLIVILVIGIVLATVLTQSSNSEETETAVKLGIAAGRYLGGPAIAFTAAVDASTA